VNFLAVLWMLGPNVGASHLARQAKALSPEAWGRGLLELMAISCQRQGFCQKDGVGQLFVGRRRRF